MTTTTTERDLRQEWETPHDFFDVVDREFGFMLDAAATQKNKKLFYYFGPRHHVNNAGCMGEDALDKHCPWIRPHRSMYSVWLNPGFSDVGPWMERAYTEAQVMQAVSVVVVMALIAPSTKWWRDWAMKACEIRLLGGKRIQFVAPEGVKQSSNARENCLIIFRPNPHNLPPRIWTWDWNSEGAK